MQLSHLLQDDYQLPVNLDRPITGLSLDSRTIKKNNVFIALKGTKVDGRKYITEVIARGAAAVLINAEPNISLTYIENVPIIPLPQLAKKVGNLAARFYHNPARALRIIGVTGTSGKTSCTHFLAQALQSLSIPCGMIGTLGSGFYEDLGNPGLTTPDALTLQSMLRDFIDQGAEAVAMEVSSHSIDQGRVSAIDFDMGIFTNLSQDHLDYHGNIETYAAVKRRFLAELPTKQLIINADDAYGKKWIAELASAKPIIAYSLSKPNSLPINVQLVYAENIELTLQGIKAKVRTPWGEGNLFLPLVGEFNLSNGLAVLSALCAYGISLTEALACLAKINSVPGRMQILGGENQPLIVVDYAHKPDALQKVLQALRAHVNGKLACVFGCGGERDRGKRPIMAKIAESLADHIIVTNDNPRHEKPEDIAAEIMQGFSRPHQVSVELDRSKAIENSIQWASDYDCVLIAGKGAEHYQQIGDEKIPFDDVEKVKEYLQVK